MCTVKIEKNGTKNRALWNTTSERDEGQRLGEMARAYVRDDKYEVNHWRGREDKLNQLERL